MRHVLNPLIHSLEKGEAPILGGIIRSSGSAPRTSGARILVQEDGSLVGSVGGGAIEKSCYDEARRLQANSRTFSELHFDLSSYEAASEGMVCGGSVSILLYKVEPEALPDFLEIKEHYNKGRRPHLLTQLPSNNSPPRLFTYCSHNNVGFPREVKEKIAAKNRREPFVVNSSAQEFFIEPIVQPGTIHLAGGGHVALATAELAHYADFQVHVMDDREEFANKERFPNAKKIQITENFRDCFTDLGQDDYVIIVTRGHLHDRDVLAQALRTDAGYIGMIGSSKKRKAVYASLLNEGFHQSDLSRVFSPIGLPIGADTPIEIGFSIVSELIKIRAGLD